MIDTLKVAGIPLAEAAQPAKIKAKHGTLNDGRTAHAYFNFSSAPQEFVYDRGRGLILVVNKWDLLRKKGIQVQEILGGDKHARCAEPALGGVVGQECILERGKLLALGEPFHGDNHSALGLDNRHSAAVDNATIHQDGAGPAFAFATAFLGAGELQIFSEHIQETGHGMRHDGVGGPVYCHGH